MLWVLLLLFLKTQKTLRMEDIKRQGLRTHKDWKTEKKLKAAVSSNGNLCTRTKAYSNE